MKLSYWVRITRACSSLPLGYHNQSVGSQYCLIYELTDETRTNVGIWTLLSARTDGAFSL